MFFSEQFSVFLYYLGSVFSIIDWFVEVCRLISDRPICRTELNWLISELIGDRTELGRTELASIAPWSKTST